MSVLGLSPGDQSGSSEARVEQSPPRLEVLREKSIQTLHVKSSSTMSHLDQNYFFAIANIKMAALPPAECILPIRP